MLQLQRASAGSGKTYVLTKKFIWFLIAVKYSEHHWRLKSNAEIKDSLPRILAVTFTNKATNEMKARIVEKLAALSLAADPRNVTEEYIENTDYLKEFSNELKVGYTEIGKVCSSALSILLNNYSDFRVSTIDSFFQTILRTFTYETNLNESYQLEIDSDYLAEASIESILNELDLKRGGNPALTFWLQTLMTNEASHNSKWNIFNKKSKSDIYLRIRNAFSKMDDEGFKMIADDLDEYFSKPDADLNLITIYQRLKESERQRKELTKEINDIGNQLAEITETIPMDSLKDVLNHHFISHIKKASSLKFDDKRDEKTPFVPLDLSDGKSVFKARKKINGFEILDELALKLYELIEKWKDPEENPLWTSWCIFGPLIPYFGILMVLRQKLKEILQNENLIRVDDTKTILKKIIGDDDAPFIYERLGTFLNNFLIDEFQDTSNMQWDVFYPLLKESDGRGEDNLIIGDAKQSIYRFRNAESKLISEIVENTFHELQSIGQELKDNTNWRSAKNIVRFNNFFFAVLVDFLASDRDKKGGIVPLEKIYSNVIQYPAAKVDKGYVEIQFLNSSSSNNEESTEEPQTDNITITHIGPLITDLIKRGYRQRDIAVIVSKNLEGKSIIDGLMKYNATLPPDSVRIEFISEQSLLVSSSPAVAIIIDVLKQTAEKLASHFSGNDSPGSETTRKRYGRDLKGSFTSFAMRHPEWDITEQIENFFNNDTTFDDFVEKLSKMQSVSLPALVEVIADTFVPQDMNLSQAAFISALQDMVLEYSSSHPSDPASFLEWWNSKGSTHSISSPEEIDAIQIMTIHKSKGLEFKCVILPFANDSFLPSSKKVEWKWVSPFKLPGEWNFPPYLPVELTSELKKTKYSFLYRDYLDQIMLDKLNNYYVAFTRAVDELYIFCKKPAKKNNSINRYLDDICSAPTEFLNKIPENLREYCVDPGCFSYIPEPLKIIYGKKPDIVLSNEKQNKNDENILIPSYTVNGDTPILNYIETETPASLDEEDPDPRSEGNILHSIMSQITHKEDIRRALLSLRMKGIITRIQAEGWEKRLYKLLSEPLVSEWFDKNWSVVNERNIYSGHQTLRPDRIIISKENEKAIIIDYKFGNKKDDRKYGRQVKSYVENFKKATNIKMVEGYVWYVKLGEIVKI